MWWWNLPWACQSLIGEQTEVDRGSQTLPVHDWGSPAQLVSAASSLVILYNWETVSAKYEKKCEGLLKSLLLFTTALSCVASVTFSTLPNWSVMTPLYTISSFVRPPHQSVTHVKHLNGTQSPT